MNDPVPLSSMSSIPVTAATRDALVDAGVSPSNIHGLSEMGAQSLLVLHQHVNDSDGTHAPDCYQRQYAPATPMCRGCVYAPRCWRSDARYLKLLTDQKAMEPAGVPEHVVTARLADVADAPTPPPPPIKAARSAPPTPPPRQRKSAPPPPRKQ